MSEHDGNGGSYLRQKDGSLKLVSRTEPPEASAQAIETPNDAPKAVGGKKENADG